MRERRKEQARAGGEKEAREGQKDLTGCEVCSLGIFLCDGPVWDAQSECVSALTRCKSWQCAGLSKQAAMVKTHKLNQWSSWWMFRRLRVEFLPLEWLQKILQMQFVGSGTLVICTPMQFYKVMIVIRLKKFIKELTSWNANTNIFEIWSAHNLRTFSVDFLFVLVPSVHVHDSK